MFFNVIYHLSNLCIVFWTFIFFVYIFVFVIKEIINLFETDKPLIAKRAEEYGEGVERPNITMLIGESIENPFGEFLWQDVTETLPPEGERVLVYLRSERSYTVVDTDRMINGKWVRWGNDVVYWMPLPISPDLLN